jgi:hypothetical protein
MKLYDSWAVRASEAVETYAFETQILVWFI